MADDAADLAQTVTFVRSSMDAPLRVASRIKDFLQSFLTDLIWEAGLPYEMKFICLSPAIDCALCQSAPIWPLLNRGRGCAFMKDETELIAVAPVALSMGILPKLPRISNVQNNSPFLCERTWCDERDR